jgi:hypothetical protein
MRWSDFENFPYKRLMEMEDMRREREADMGVFLDPIDQAISRAVNRFISQIMGAFGKR